LRLRAALLVLLLPSASGATAPAPLILPAFALQQPLATVLPPGRQAVSVQLVQWGNYPHLGAAFQEGLPGALEFGLHGLFHHQRVDGFGETFRYDFDEYGGTLRWGAAPNLPSRGAAAAGVGFSRFTHRQAYTDGRYSFNKQRYWWAEAVTQAAPAADARIAVTARRLWVVRDGAEMDSLAGGVELPPLGGLSLLGEFGWMIRNPLNWRRTWAAGARMPGTRTEFTFYASNTWGPNVPDALYGTTDVFYNVRVTFGL
jgi:hypothetical protein